jgi:hypothetical protein
MTPHPTHTDLLRRVREAVGPDRELDRDLFWSFEPVQSGIAFANAAMGLARPMDHTQPIPGALGRLGVEVSAPLYTASLDSALALVERVRPGQKWMIASVGYDAGVWQDGKAGAYLYDPILTPPRWKGFAATPALALLAALLASPANPDEGE